MSNVRVKKRSTERNGTLTENFDRGEIEMSINSTQTIRIKLINVGPSCIYVITLKPVFLFLFFIPTVSYRY